MAVRRLASISACCEAVRALFAASHTAASHLDKDSTTPPALDGCEAA